MARENCATEIGSAAFGVFVFAQSAIKSTMLSACERARARVCIQRFTDTIIYARITAQPATTEMREKYVPTRQKKATEIARWCVCVSVLCDRFCRR